MKRRIHFPVLVVVALFAVSFFATSFFGAKKCQADVITFEMSGTVEVSDLWDLLPDDIVSHMPFTARLTYDLDTPDADADDPQVGSYDHNPPGGSSYPFGLSINIGNHAFAADPEDDFVLSVGNDLSVDSYGIQGDWFALRNIDFVTNFEGQVQMQILQFDFRDSSGMSFQSDRLPEEVDVSLFRSPNIPTFSEYPQIRMTGDTGRVVRSGSPGISIPEIYFIEANVDRIAIVPEPASISIAMVAILSVGFILLLRSSQRRSRNNVLKKNAE